MAWSHKDVVKLTAPFIPAADEVGRLASGSDAASIAFRKIATRHVQGLRTSQGTYVLTPSASRTGSRRCSTAYCRRRCGSCMRSGWLAEARAATDDCYGHGPQLPSTIARSAGPTTPSPFKSAMGSFGGTGPQLPRMMARSAASTVSSPLRSAGHIRLWHGQLSSHTPSAKPTQLLSHRLSQQKLSSAHTQSTQDGASQPGCPVAEQQLLVPPQTAQNATA